MSNCGHPGHCYDKMEQRMNFYEKGQGAMKAMYAVNVYNRISIAFKVQGGSYQPGEHGK